MNENHIDEEYDKGKIEKLSQRANVSEEAAKEALSECNGDLLDAMVYLENHGAAPPPEKAVYSTSVADKESYEDVSKVVEQHEEANDPSFGEQLIRLIKTGFQKSLDNSLVVSHKGVEKFRLPLLVIILVLLFGHFFILVVMGVSLFFDVRYRIEGKDDLSGVNRLMDDAGNKASTWMKEKNQKEAETKSNKNDTK